MIKQKPDVREMSQHILDLCFFNNIDIYWRNHYRGTALPKRKTILIPRIKSPITYALALHEIGHILGKKSGRRIDQEVQAWEWAKESALIWTDSMQDKASRCLNSYLEWTQRSRRAYKPPKTHPVFKWVTRVK